MTEQQPSRSSNHLSPSAATGRPDEPAEGHLFGPQPAEAGHSDADSPTGENNENNDDPSKHHVGPVMGIFFKVWSLVKGRLSVRGDLSKAGSGRRSIEQVSLDVCRQPRD